MNFRICPKIIPTHIFSEIDLSHKSIFLHEAEAQDYGL